MSSCNDHCDLAFEIINPKHLNEEKKTISISYWDLTGQYNKIF